jgi:hypothetical protein
LSCVSGAGADVFIRPPGPAVPSTDAMPHQPIPLGVVYNLGMTG